MSFGPQKITLPDLGVWVAGAFISGSLASIFVLIVVFLFSGVLDIAGTMSQAKAGTATTPVFPFIFSVITFVALLITTFGNYLIGHAINPERSKKSTVHLGQIFFFNILIYTLITPLYIYIGIKNYEFIMFIFILHVLVVNFGLSLVLEVLNNYRYILTGIYGSFFGLFFTTIITLLIFSRFSTSHAKLLSLLIILPLINMSIHLFKGLFELAYYKYTKATALDQLGDIFYQIEMAEREKLKEEEEMNSV